MQGGDAVGARGTRPDHGVTGTSHAPHLPRCSTGAERLANACGRNAAAAPIREAGGEHYGGVMDAQMRNAIYGYGSASDNVERAAYMREVVMPGMAALLHRPAYDFTRTYEYNREQFAFGCYHCHKVK